MQEEADLPNIQKEKKETCGYNGYHKMTPLGTVKLAQLMFSLGFAVTAITAAI